MTFICFGNSLRGEFVADDYFVVVGNRYIQSVETLPQLFTHSYFYNNPSQGFYRPLANLSFALNYGLGRLNPWGYHLINLLLHAFNGLLVYWLACRYTGREGVSLWIALLFVAHPVHVEVVSNIAGRPELLACSGVLLAWFFYRPDSDWRYYGLSLFAYFLGLLAKESAVVLPGILILTDLCERHDNTEAFWPNAARRYTGYLLVLGTYLLIRVSAVKQVGIPVVVTLFKAAPLQTRVLTMSLAVLRYLKLMVWPRDLIALYDFSVIPLTTTLSFSVVFALMLILLLLAVALWQFRTRPLLSFAILFFFMTISPVSNIVVATGVLVADRVLYLSVLGICAVVAAARRTGSVMVIAMLAILLAAALRDNTRNQDWMNQIAYLQALVRDLPNSPYKARNLEELGSRLAMKQDYESAASYLKQAVAINPSSIDGTYNTGLILDKLHRSDEALTYLGKAARLSPRDIEIRNVYAAKLLQANRLEPARDEFEAVIAINPNVAASHNSLGIIYARENQPERAREEFMMALRLQPDYPEAAHNLELLGVLN